MLMTHQQSAELAKPGIGSLHDPAAFVASQFASIFVACRARLFSGTARSTRCRVSSAARATGRNRRRESAITRSGFCRGRPLGRGTRTSASVASASVTSAERHFPAELPAEDPDRRPVPSTSCPCPAWFYRRQSPFFRRSEAAVQEGLVPFQQTLVVQRPQQRAPRLQPDAFLLPLLQPPPAGRGRRNSSGRKRHAAPVCRIHRMPSKQARFEAHGRPRLSSPSPRRRQQRLHQFPLLVGQQLLPLLHGRSSSANPPHT